MLGRRVLLGTAAAGMVEHWMGSLAAQESPREPAKTKKPAPVRAASPSAAPVTPDPQLERVLAPVRDKHHLPGMIGAVLEGERLAAIGAVGLRKIGSDAPIRVDDLVHLGSCTKAMTATLVGMIVEEGKLHWTSTIREVFPARAKELHADFQAVTLAQLLAHRAGLPHDGPWWELGSNKTTSEQRRVLLSRVLAKPPESKPGSKYAYSNVGYALAGLMAEQVTGKSWETLMRARLFEPLGMNSAGFGPPGKTGQVDQPWGHHEVDAKVEPIQGDNAPALGPAGTVHVSIPDWAKFAALHSRAAQGKPRLLEAQTFHVLHTPPNGDEYAGGWLVLDRSWAGGPALTHSGSNTMWYATVWLAPLRDFGLLVATNQGGDAAAAACDEAVGELIKFHSFANGPSSGPRRKTARRG